MKKIFIKCDKLNRICEIVYAGAKKDATTPKELKPTLNFFRGKQFTKSNRYELITYANLSLKAQEGNVEAQKCLDEIHCEWNQSPITKDYE